MKDAHIIAVRLWSFHVVSVALDVLVIVAIMLALFGARWPLFVIGGLELSRLAGSLSAAWRAKPWAPRCTGACDCGCGRPCGRYATHDGRCSS